MDNSRNSLDFDNEWLRPRGEHEVLGLLVGDPALVVQLLDQDVRVSHLERK